MARPAALAGCGIAFGDAEFPSAAVEPSLDIGGS